MTPTPAGYKHLDGRDAMLHYEVIRVAPDRVSLLLRGELVEDVTAERLESDLERHYVDDGVRTIQVDLGEVEAISLEGVATLVELWRASRRRGKELVVVGAEGQVREKLLVTGLLAPLAGDAG
jgi:anti-anti-sigma factor